MLWIVVAAVGLALLVTSALLPLQAMKRARALGYRGDGSASPRRRATEREQVQRVVQRGLVRPVAGVAVLGLAMVGAHVLTPWSALSDALGSSTSESDLLSEQLIERFREAEAERRLAETLDNPAAQPPAALGQWMTEHWPLHPLFLLMLTLAVWKAYRVSVREHIAYTGKARVRRREYRRHDEKMARADAATDAEAG